MIQSLEKVKNLSLEVNHPTPRIFSVFGEQLENVINAVELESTGASLVLKAHYENLPFGSKPQSYWDEKNVKVGEILFTKFLADYMSWSVMIGLRNYLDDLALLDLKNCLLEEYTIHNEESVKTAIKMNLRGDFGDVIEAFGQFNRIYLTKIMSGYQKKLLQDHKRAIEIREKLKKPIELTDKQKEDLLKIEIQNVYHEYVVELRDDIELISYVMYDYLDKVGKIKLDKDKKDKLMEQSKNELLTMPKNKYSIQDLDNNKNAKLELVVIAKRIAVKNYFNELIGNNIENIF
jgi:hypothetical protein